jgi:DNA-directed RNA polymerase specialized sigma24 family protein
MARDQEKVSRRMVRLTNRTRRKAWAKLWAYSYADLAELFDMTEGGVRRAVERGRVDPSSLRNICRFWAIGHHLLPEEAITWLDEDEE